MSLRAKFGHLRRPFFGDKGTHATDVWTYPPVEHFKGKHPCAKPTSMARDIIIQCSRPGDVVLDTFCGSGVFLIEAARAGRVAWGCDMDSGWAEAVQQLVDTMRNEDAPIMCGDEGLVFEG